MRLKNHLLLKRDDSSRDYARLDIPKAYQILEFVLSELAEEKPIARHGSSGRAFITPSDNLSLEAISPKNIALIQSEGKKIVDLLEEKIDAQQFDTHKKKQWYSSREKKYNDKEKCKVKKRKRRKQLRDKTKQNKHSKTAI
jgi:hypothetical protein